MEEKKIFERGMRVQVWDIKDESNPKYLGYGTVTELSHSVLDKEVIHVFSDKLKSVIYSGRYNFIPEKKADKIAERIWEDIFGEEKKDEK